MSLSFAWNLMSESYLEDDILPLSSSEDKGINATIAQGGNPNNQRHAERAEMTFGALFSEYLDRYAKLHKRSWKEDQSQFNHCLVPWQSRKLSTISKTEYRNYIRILNVTMDIMRRVPALCSINLIRPPNLVYGTKRIQH